MLEHIMCLYYIPLKELKRLKKKCKCMCELMNINFTKHFKINMHKNKLYLVFIKFYNFENEELTSLINIINIKLENKIYDKVLSKHNLIHVKKVIEIIMYTNIS